MMDRARLAELNRLLELKRLLNDGKLTREEFEALKQKELQADGTDRGSDRGSDCASERSASPAPVIVEVIGVPVYGAATGSAVPGAPGASSTPTLAEMGEVSHLPAGQASAGACSDSKHAGGMKTTDPFAVPTTSNDFPAEQSKEMTREAAGEPPKQKLFSNPFFIVRAAPVTEHRSRKPWCPPTNRKATAKRFGIALLISLILLALAFAIYVGTCRRAQSVFTSREDLRRAIELYDIDEGFCDSLHGGKIPIEAWDVSAVTDMSYLFSSNFDWDSRPGQDCCRRKLLTSPSSTSFNSELLCHRCWERTIFDQDISAWNVSAVTDMSRMFSNAYSFNQDISAWNVLAVRDMSYMFFNAFSFDKILCSDVWRASEASRSYMFYGTNGAGICE